MASIPVEAIRARARALAATRAFFDRDGFVEVDTPLAVPSPGLDLHLDAASVELVREQRFLITSPEYQMKRLLVAGMPALYQLCHCFRRNEHGSNHQPEFTMLEWYRVGARLDELMHTTERLVAHLAMSLNGHTRLRRRGREIDVAQAWERISVEDAFLRFAGISMHELDDDTFFRLLVERVEPGLEQLSKGVHLHRYPARMASLARLDEHDPRVALRFESYLFGVELCNGFDELTDASEQKARFESDQRERARVGKPVYPIDDAFIADLRRGLPSCAGNALGFDRVLMLVLGAASIADVTAFPVERL